MYTYQFQQRIYPDLHNCVDYWAAPHTLDPQPSWLHCSQVCKNHNKSVYAIISPIKLCIDPKQIATLEVYWVNI